MVLNRVDYAYAAAGFTLLNHPSTTSLYSKCMCQQSFPTLEQKQQPPLFSSFPLHILHFREA